MPRRKEPRIPDALLDQLLGGADAKTAFDRNGLLDELKKALAEGALNAEIHHHLGRRGAALATDFKLAVLHWGWIVTDTEGAWHFSQLDDGGWRRSRNGWPLSREPVTSPCLAANARTTSAQST